MSASPIRRHPDVAITAEFQNLYAQLSTRPAVSHGSGAPSFAPVRIGDVYLDTSAKKEYRAFGVESASDWVAVN